MMICRYFIAFAIHLTAVFAGRFSLAVGMTREASKATIVFPPLYAA